MNAKEQVTQKLARVTDWERFSFAMVDYFELTAQARSIEGASTAGLYATVARDIQSMFDQFLFSELSYDEAMAWTGLSRAGLKRYRRAGIRFTRSTLPHRPPALRRGLHTRIDSDAAPST